MRSQENANKVSHQNKLIKRNPRLILVQQPPKKRKIEMISKSATDASGKAVPKLTQPLDPEVRITHKPTPENFQTHQNTALISIPSLDPPSLTREKRHLIRDMFYN